MKMYKLTIQGDVQAVGFRYEAKQIAESLGIVGFVRNESDGTVYIEAQGIDTNIKKFIQWCKNGPAAARVKNVEIFQSNSDQTYTSFTIRR